jgi:hypothetical protein
MQVRAIGITNSWTVYILQRTEAEIGAYLSDTVAQVGENWKCPYHFSAPDGIAVNMTPDKAWVRVSCSWERPFLAGFHRSGTPHHRAFLQPANGEFWPICLVQEGVRAMFSRIGEWQLLAESAVQTYLETDLL